MVTFARCVAADAKRYELARFEFRLFAEFRTETSLFSLELKCVSRVITKPRIRYSRALVACVLFNFDLVRLTASRPVVWVDYLN